MKKGYLYLIGSVALLGGGYLLYRKFARSVEDNASVNQEQENTSGSNSIQVGDVIYPSGSYVNVRYSAMVNNGLINNLMLEVSSPNAIGVVEDILISDGHTWYKVQMNQDLTDNMFGFVRSDVVSKTI